LAQGFKEPRWWLLCLVYLAFVVYGSLVPFEWRDVPLGQALTQFSHIRLLHLGAASRADWVANIVLYVPLAFLGCAALFGLRVEGLLAPVAALLVFLLCTAIAVAVEFTQIFFAPRTVSLNDLLAEAIGAGIGASLWLFGRWQVVRLGLAFARGGRASVLAVLVVFVVAYLLLSLFPYDFVVSRAELHAVLREQGRAFLSFGCESWLRCFAFWVVEVLSIAPLGLLLILLHPRWPLARLFLLGIGVGLVLEPLQLVLVSGKGLLLSILLRGLGVLLGGLLGRRLTTHHDIGALAALGWRLVPWLAVPYVLAVMALSGWWNGAWLGFAGAVQKLSTLDWEPFYYHYWTSEPVAMVSLLAQLAMYAPIGVAAWLRAFARAGGRASQWWPAVVATGMALVIEAGKLFAPGARPDPTNLIIAAVGAWLAYAAATWLGRLLSTTVTSRGVAPRPAFHALAPTSDPRAAKRSMSDGHALSGAPRGPRSEPEPIVIEPAPLPTPAVPAQPRAMARGPASVQGAAGKFRQMLAVRDESFPEPTILGYLYALGCGAATVTGIVLYPFAQFWLAAALALFAVALWRWPWLWLAVVPVGLPVLDLTPWSGQLLLNAFDLIVLVGLGAAGLRLSGIRPARLPNVWLGLALLLLGTSWLVATGIGLDASRGSERWIASSHPLLAPWYAGKGLLWALLAVPLLRRFRRLLGSTRASRLLLPGAVVGLIAVCTVVVYERVVHVGLFDLDEVFRVSGPFASMHDGGAYVEAYLAFAFPMMLVWMFIGRRRWQLALGAMLVPVAAYAMLVTFSRGGYGGFAVGSVVVLLGLLAGVKSLPKARWLVLFGMLAVVGAAAVPALTTGFAGERLARIGADLNTRLVHWRHAIGLMDDGFLTTTFGEGFGRYPVQYLLASPPDKAAGTFEVRKHNDNGYLHLGKGEAVYLDQRVPVRAQTRYLLTLRVRGYEAGARLSVPLCEKALLYSFSCVWNRLKPQTPGQWQTLAIQVRSGQVGSGGRWPHGPVKLSLYNAGVGPIDVDDVSLTSPQGRELIANGGFEHGAERWLFVTDQDPAWHIHEQFVETYFAQGLLGLLATAVLLIAAFAVLLPAIRAGRYEGVAFAGALTGFLSVGALGSTVDAPRTAMLLYLGAFCAVILVRGKDARTRRRKSGGRANDAPPVPRVMPG
jgi:VanZ family protein